MKKIFTIIVLLVASVTLFAQSDVTKFLGIPVDGFKPDMIRKLKEKGFVSTEYDKDVLEGEFNGTDVYIGVVTNNNKVYRIGVTDKNSISETDIRIRFNKLCRQFADNPKYTTPILTSVDDYIISEDEDISYEISVNNKRYQAAFYQKPDSIAQQKDLENYKNYILEKYTEEELNDSTIAKKLLQEVMLYAMDVSTKKSVWFMISESYGKYYIIMFYDNEYNRANGEDL
ncbi:MAG: hypothetical protein J6A44_05375 [Paludibacteraceae bacterium]|nr:hypothetical protein [Paludibacteraceae bacterium]